MSETAATGALETVAEAFRERFGEDAATETAFGELTVTVPSGKWIAALELASYELGLRFFDWLTAVDEETAGFTVVAHVAAVADDGRLPRATRVLLQTRIPAERPELATATGVYRGAAWHERETFEMFGISFPGHPHLVPLLLPDGFEGHPLRKDFVLASRVAKEWPGVKEPGEGGGHGGGAPAKASATRRRMVPPGVPDGWLKPLAGEEPESAADEPTPERTRPARPERTAPARVARSGAAAPAAEQTVAAAPEPAAEPTEAAAPEPAIEPAVAAVPEPEAMPAVTPESEPAAPAESASAAEPGSAAEPAAAEQPEAPAKVEPAEEPEPEAGPTAEEPAPEAEPEEENTAKPAAEPKAKPEPEPEA